MYIYSGHSFPLVYFILLLLLLLLLISLSPISFSYPLIIYSLLASSVACPTISIQHHVYYYYHHHHHPYYWLASIPLKKATTLIGLGVLPQQTTPPIPSDHSNISNHQRECQPRRILHIPLSSFSITAILSHRYLLEKRHLLSRPPAKNKHNNPRTSNPACQLKKKHRRCVSSV